MDVGIFKANNARLVGWIALPPLLIVAVGLSSFALQQRADWKLNETQALSAVLPEILVARMEVQRLLDNLGLSEGNRISTGDQLIDALSEKADLHDVDLRKTEILGSTKPRGSKVPIISLAVDAGSDFSSLEHFLNDIKSSYPMVFTRNLTISQDGAEVGGKGFQIKVVFDLLLADDVLKIRGGLK